MKNRDIIYYRVGLLLIFVFAIVIPTLSFSNQTKGIIINRFDKDMLTYLEAPTTESADRLIKKYPVFLPAFAQTITKNDKDGEYLNELRKYFSHPALNKIYKDAISQFEDLSLVEKEIEAMIGIAQQELGISKVPLFSVHVSGFKENIIYVNNTISLSIDKYLGKEYSGYKGFFKGFQVQQMQPHMLVRDFAKAWMMADFINTERHTENVISEMIEQGKLLYALSVMLPDYNEYDIIGYTESEYQWAINNESKVWQSVNKQNHLNSTDLHVISSYFDERPNKLPMKGAPVKIGAWVGFRIVKKYAEYKKQSLSTILKANPQIMLKESKYKP